ncbi:MAG: exodeoxyribonuclease VII large subunit [Planctomycetota bacterium]|jgi:exodeoxyribonuclease VII large subunit
MQKDRAKIYTVSQVNSLIKEVLENNLPGRLTITGEITGWKLHQSGHCYFSLKDENSQLPCVMWRSSFARVKFQPENGLAVLATGHVDVYAPQGKYQFYVDTMMPAGTGALQLAFEQMVKRLRAEGLFDEKYKKPLPAYPERIGILTSESGAAVHDIIDSIHNRWPCVSLFLYPVAVQGEGAAQDIASALRDINRRNDKLKLDILIVGRGGGSLEDLWAFNEEVLARAIFDSQIPVISAVGHEVDTTIADLVADARASTPTKAGVVAVPDMYEVLGDLANKESRLMGIVRGRLELAQQSLRTILASSVFRNPLLAVRDRQQQLDEAHTRLAELTRAIVNRARTMLQASYEQIMRIEPHRLIAKVTVDLNSLQNRAAAAANATLNKCRLQLTAKENLLAGLNPKSVLQRGYSITTSRETGLLVRRSEDVEIGDVLVTELAEENLIESKVTRK